ncbi:MAG: GAF domain-containing protein [Clostridiales bacterium]|nr:GAF domain-containing protein [Clostridiales bacterium]
MHQDAYESVEQLANLLDETDPVVTTLANASAFLNELLDRVNWVGFYLLQDGALRLGPFQGKPACTVIPAGKGVCGAAIAENRTQRVEDVHAFPGHIACDSASNSELVVPLRGADGAPIGVLDIDSPVRGRFSERDQRDMERAAQIISLKIVNWTAKDKEA